MFQHFVWRFKVFSPDKYKVPEVVKKDELFPGSMGTRFLCYRLGTSRDIYNSTALYLHYSNTHMVDSKST